MQVRVNADMPGLACLRGISDQRGRTMNELVYSYLPVLIFAAIGGFIALGAVRGSLFWWLRASRIQRRSLHMNAVSILLMMPA